MSFAKCIIFIVYLESEKTLKEEERQTAEQKKKKKDTRAKKNITSSLQKGELVLLLAKRIKKKDAHGRLRKSTTKNKTLF